MYVYHIVYENIMFLFKHNNLLIINYILEHYKTPLNLH